MALALLHDGLVRSTFVLSEHISRLAELAARYADRKPDLADLCLIRLSELHPRYPVITTDLAGFRVPRPPRDYPADPSSCAVTSRAKSERRLPGGILSFMELG